jgi:hypothetical protein
MHDSSRLSLSATNHLQPLLYWRYLNFILSMMSCYLQQSTRHIGNLQLELVTETKID